MQFWTQHCLSAATIFSGPFSSELESFPLKANHLLLPQSLCPPYLPPLGPAATSSCFSFLFLLSDSHCPTQVFSIQWHPRSVLYHAPFPSSQGATVKKTLHPATPLPDSKVIWVVAEQGFRPWPLTYGPGLFHMPHPLHGAFIRLGSLSTPWRDEARDGEAEMRSLVLMEGGPGQAGFWVMTESKRGHH